MKVTDLTEEQREVLQDLADWAKKHERQVSQGFITDQLDIIIFDSYLSLYLCRDNSIKVQDADGNTEIFVGKSKQGEC